MFPIDSASKDYNKGMIEKFDKLISNKNLPYTISDLLPKVLVAGENAGTLSEEGAKLLDTTGTYRKRFSRYVRICYGCT